MNRLSARELEVARLVAEELEDSEVANILGISIRTVQEYLERIVLKLRVGHSPLRRRDAIRHAVHEADASLAAGHEHFAAIWAKYVTDGRPAPLPSPTWLYVIRRRDTHEVKIGVSIEPHGRLKTLQGAHGGDLELVATIPATAFTEGELHTRFAAYRKKREWFDESPEITLWIESIAPLKRRAG